MAKEEKYSSFICEHTAEYVLVPRLTEILVKRFNTVVPIFPWMTREGNSLSRYIHGGDNFKVLGFFPRRPKINYPVKEIIVKINEELKRSASDAIKFGIPMVAGCPLAFDFWGLNKNVKCFWVKLTDTSENYYKIEYNHEYEIEHKSCMDEGITQEDELLGNILENSKVQSLNSLIPAIQVIKRNINRSFFMGFGSYKPIYFLLRD